MANETKKRLLLSRWRDQDLRDEIDQCEAKIADLEAERDEIAETLEQVKYWLHDGLVHHKLVSDPRALLRKVEDAIG